MIKFENYTVKRVVDESDHYRVTLLEKSKDVYHIHLTVSKDLKRYGIWISHGYDTPYHVPDVLLHMIHEALKI